MAFPRLAPFIGERRPREAFLEPEGAAFRLHRRSWQIHASFTCLPMDECAVMF